MAAKHEYVSIPQLCRQEEQCIFSTQHFTAALSYSARGYDLAVCCSNMSCDAFLSEALYEADKVLEKFAAVPRECACLQDGGWSRR